MVTTQQDGSSSDNRNQSLGRIVQVTGISAGEYEDVIRDQLLTQERSWNRYHTIDDMLANIAEHYFTAWIVYNSNGECKGLALTKVMQYSPDTRSLFIEFVSCKHFFFMSKLSRYLEDHAIFLGCKMIEAITPPALATVAVRKFGYAAPNIHIVKPLGTGKTYNA